MVIIIWASNQTQVFTVHYLNHYVDYTGDKLLLSIDRTNKVNPVHLHGRTSSSVDKSFRIFCQVLGLQSCSLPPQKFQAGLNIILPMVSMINQDMQRKPNLSLLQ